MITPEQFQEIGETLLPLLDDLTEWIARDMIERFMIRFGRGEEKLLTGTDEWQAWVLEQAGGNLDEIQKALAKSTGKSQQEIAKIFKDSGVQAAKADAEAAAVTFSGLSPGMMAIITDAYERTVGEISNITRTTAGATNQAFIDICDAAYWKVRTGAQSYTAAMLEGVKALGQVQPIVRYPSGHKDTLEVAVLRCIRTGVAQSSGNMTIQQCKDMGWNHVLVSQHLGARVSDTDPVADHAGWQGKVYCVDGKDAQFDNLLDATGYPENPLGLCGYNCRHSFTPFLPGVSQNHNKPIDTEANRRAYELSQTQRAMERRIRAQKRKCTALHTAVKSCEDPAGKAKLQEKYAQSAKRLQEQNAAYTKFCADNDLKPYHERLTVAGWNRSAASTASAAVRVQGRGLKNESAKVLENLPEDGIIASKESTLTHRRVTADGREIINKATYSKLVNPVIKKGGKVITASVDNDWIRYLGERGATAVTIGDTIVLRPDATTTEVLEEVYHFYQNRSGLNAQYSAVQRMVMNEIAAQKYLMSIAERYKIPQSEREETKALLESYIKQKEELIKAGEWDD